MQNVTSCWWHSHFQGSIVVQQFGRSQLDLVAQSLHFFGANIDTNQRVAKVYLGFLLTSVQKRRRVGVDNSARVILILHQHRFHLERFRTVLAKHGDHSIQNNIRLC
eukprot:Lithocolla_globosa_v1_NODE_4326_length_1462_cov_5.537313.p3 type:complete len:107 gc:universal NODE_4326_length_1462_cov_5.537313:835-1155(+)